MKEYDLIVIGSGAGMNIASNAIERGLKVAVIEQGPLGGTCLNNGCIPSKVLLYPADVIRKLGDANAIGIEARIGKIDFARIMRRMRAYVAEGRQEMEQGVAATKDLALYRETGEFVSDHTLKVGEETISAPKIVIASGARPLIPPAEGLAEVGYLDNVSVLEMNRLPTSLIIIGGGYIACEYAHFFSAMGVKTMILGRNPRLLKEEEPEISEIVQRQLGRFVDIRTNHEVRRVRKGWRGKAVTVQDRGSGREYEIRAQEIMVAAGRISNADLLKPERSGVKTDEQGWIVVNEYLETSKEGIWALGDATGRYMFRHTANEEADIVWTNAFGEHKHEMRYQGIPHAVFTYPQVAAVGMGEEEARRSVKKLLVGHAHYGEVVKGFAMAEEDALVKALVDGENGRILGCHIVGSEAAILVQAIAYLMHAGEGDYMPLALAETIHPALSEVVMRAFGSLEPVEQEHTHVHGS
jgi:dihydrolipoamide dehydrogenase